MNETAEKKKTDEVTEDVEEENNEVEAEAEAEAEANDEDAEKNSEPDSDEDNEAVEVSFCLFIMVLRFMKHHRIYSQGKRYDGG